MSVDGRAVANFILDFCEGQQRSVTNLSLQKIVYFCHVWSLVELGHGLVKHEFEAWQYGPVLEYLYREFRHFQNSPIVGRATRINPSTGAKEIVPYSFDARLDELLQNVVDFYSRVRPSDLVALTHAKGGPWDQAWNHQGSVNPGMKIDENSIVRYYSKAPQRFAVQ